MEVNKYEVSLILPNYTNDGISNQEAINSILTSIASQFGGYTIQHVNGGWLDNGQLYEDESTRVFTLVDSAEDVNLLSQAASIWAKDLQQLELLFTVHQLNVSFIAGIK